MVEAKILVGDNRKTLLSLEDQSIQTVVTSPPYWGLRDYGTGNWVGGDELCSHKRESKFSESTSTGHAKSGLYGIGDAIYKDSCPRCGAVREDEQIGLEVSPNDFVEQLCLVFDEVWRVLKDDGTLWINLGDTYFSSGSKNSADNHGLKSKDMVGIPWRVAFALQDRGWYLRQDIIWAKPNPMPEPVTDRCTKSHEYLFLFSKNPKYFFDNKAIAEPVVTEDGGKGIRFGGNKYGDSDDPKHATKSGNIFEGSVTRNKRDVWTVSPSRYKEAHFATYPPELISPCILAGSKQGDWVLDPFSGSGTTGEVAMQFGRNYVGLELNPDYALLSEKRLLDSCGLFGSVEIQEGK